MAFECQKDTEILLKDTCTSCSDNPVLEKGDSDQLVEINKKNFGSFHAEYSDTVTKSNARIETPFGEALLSHSGSCSDLPPALISEILNFLDPKELGIVACVSTSLYRLASDHQVWKDFYYERWGHLISSVHLGSEYSDEKSWKELFVEREFRSKTFMGRYSIDTLYGHAEAVRTVFVLVSKKLLFTSGYDQVVRMWDMEEGLSIASSRPLGCTIRAIAADTRLLGYGWVHTCLEGGKWEPSLV